MTSSSPTGPTAASMSTVEGAGQRDEGEYGRAAKRLKTEEREKEAEEREEREEGEEELEEGEDSDSGSLPGNVEAAADNRARWSASPYGAGRKVRRGQCYLTSPCSSITVAGSISIYLPQHRLLRVSRVQTGRMQADINLHSNLKDETKH